ncbi:hypothetical protein KPL40_19085 [Clostridium gasigenes]|uniref:hypothetical protein n=1 Tax=Clostridium gasigenes TaxID=94869 RepID=UPI001C0CAC89|nr:hypothetical protein [Clostridium gasigenes]MBU3134521.1 hypothetical protein [Clostridium gasigenes]
MFDENKMGLLNENELKEISCFDISMEESVDTPGGAEAAAGAWMAGYTAMAAVV